MANPQPTNLVALADKSTGRETTGNGSRWPFCSLLKITFFCKSFVKK
jgi:hypothetical protein